MVKFNSNFPAPPLGPRTGKTDPAEDEVEVDGCLKYGVACLSGRSLPDDVNNLYGPFL